MPAYGISVYVLPKLICRNHPPNVMLLGGWTLGHKGGALRNGISVRVEETPESSAAPSTESGDSEKTAVVNQGAGLRQTQPDHAGTLISAFKLPGL